MTKQIIYFAGVLLLLMAAALVVSAHDSSPALNATIKNITANNTTLNNTTINATLNNTTINATIALDNVTIALDNATLNETAPVTENASVVVAANETLPPVEAALGNVTEAPAVVNVTAPEVIEAPPAVNETEAAVASAPAIVPKEGILGKMETRPAQTVTLGMKIKPTFIVGSGLGAGETVQVGATKARETYTVGSPAKSTIGL
ncbi:hypothetical protein [Methanothrix sp.]|jgi:hypothetical protein|uniref:hypothetical protein n=1 Tax=Methanothrix sp. TaxID=90426 RepID=UPI0032AF7743